MIGHADVVPVERQNGRLAVELWLVLPSQSASWQAELRDEAVRV
jgi:hypothetical protein